MESRKNAHQASDKCDWMFHVFFNVLFSLMDSQSYVGQTVLYLGIQGLILRDNFYLI